MKNLTRSRHIDHRNHHVLRIVLLILLTRATIAPTLSFIGVDPRMGSTCQMSCCKNMTQCCCRDSDQDTANVSSKETKLTSAQLKDTCPRNCATGPVSVRHSKSVIATALIKDSTLLQGRFIYLISYSLQIQPFFPSGTERAPPRA